MRGFFSTEIIIKCWNIHGLFSNINGFRYNKLENPDFIEKISNSKIFCLLETNHTSDDISIIQLEGFKCFEVCRKPNKGGRNMED